MARDDDEPLARPRARLERLVLDPLGIGELNAYIGELKVEIARILKTEGFIRNYNLAQKEEAQG